MRCEEKNEKFQYKLKGVLKGKCITEKMKCSKEQWVRIFKNIIKYFKFLASQTRQIIYLHLNTSQ